TPTADQVGPNAVVVDVEDGQGGGQFQSFGITAVNAAPPNPPPVITSVAPLKATAGQLYQYQVTAVDPDGEQSRFALRAGRTDMTLDPVSGLLRWTPTAAEVGNQVIAVSATDPAGGTAFQQFTVAVAAANRPPAINSSPVTTVPAGLTYRY